MVHVDIVCEVKPLVEIFREGGALLATGRKDPLGRSVEHLLIQSLAEPAPVSLCSTQTLQVRECT